MNEHAAKRSRSTLRHFPLPAKVLATMVIMTMAVAMLGALGQVAVHDIIPTFQAMRAGDEIGQNSQSPVETVPLPADAGKPRGDLFSEAAPTGISQDEKAFYKTEQFVWTLKWTHIHLFGMNMIFILMGAIVLFLDIGERTRAWLIGLPFAGVLIDIGAIWLKGYVSPHFFWLHIPGGGLFGIIFIYVSIRAVKEMWGSPHALE